MKAISFTPPDGNEHVYTPKVLKFTVLAHVQDSNPRMIFCTDNFHGVCIPVMDRFVIFSQTFGKCPVFVKVVQMGAPEYGVDIDMPEEYLVPVVL